MANLDGGENCEVSWTLPDHPTIDVTMSEDGGYDGNITAVYDVLSAVDENDISGLTIQYVDGREEKFIPFPALSGGGRPGLPGPFEVTLSSGGAATFTNCVLRIARAYFFFQDQTLQGVDGTDQIIYVRAEHTDPPTISVGCGDYATVSQNLGGAWSNCLSTTITPLYRTLSGQVKCDYRYMMNIQAYDARNYSNSI